MDMAMDEADVIYDETLNYDSIVFDKYLDSTGKKIIGFIRRFGKIVPLKEKTITKEEIKNIETAIELAKTNPNENKNYFLSEVSKRLEYDAKKMGVDVGGYSHNIDVSGIRHTINKHGDEKEELRGQIKISEADFLRIPDIIENYDAVEISDKTKQGLDTLKYKKEFSDGTTYYIEEIRTGKKNLTIKTMYKRKSKGS